MVPIFQNLDIEAVLSCKGPLTLEIGTPAFLAEPVWGLFGG